LLLAVTVICRVPYVPIRDAPELLIWRDNLSG
jgi:hypothetical protein